MIELHKITWIGGIVGLSILIVSVIKWFFMELYLSKLMFGVGIGFATVCFSYIHECLKIHDKQSEHDEIRITELEFWAREKGFEK